MWFLFFIFLYIFLFLYLSHCDVDLSSFLWRYQPWWKWWRFFVTACIHTNNISGTFLQNGPKCRWVREVASWRPSEKFLRNTILQSSISNIFPPFNDHLIFPIEGRCLKTNLWRCASKTKTYSTSSPRAAKQFLTSAAKC